MTANYEKVEQAPYLYDTEDITIKAIVDYVKEEDIQELPTGLVEVGDVTLELPIIRKSLIKSAIKEKYTITIESDEYYAIDSATHPLQTHINVYCKRIR